MGSRSLSQERMPMYRPTCEVLPEASGVHFQRRALRRSTALRRCGVPHAAPRAGGWRRERAFGAAALLLVCGHPKFGVHLRNTFPPTAASSSGHIPRPILVARFPPTPEPDKRGRTAARAQSTTGAVTERMDGMFIALTHLIAFRGRLLPRLVCCGGMSERGSCAHRRHKQQTERGGIRAHAIDERGTSTRSQRHAR